MSSNLKLVKEAEEMERKGNVLISKKGFPFNFFSSYDPFRAAELFSESADIYSSLNNQIKAGELHIKAAETFLLSNEFNSKSFAAHAYNKAGDIYSSKSHYSQEKAVECYTNSSLYHSASGNFSLGANRKIAAVKILKSEGDFMMAEELMGDALDLYDKAKMPSSRSVHLEEYLFFVIKNRNYKLAGEILLEMASEKTRKIYSEFYLMFAYFSYLICNVTRDCQKEMDNVYQCFTNSEEKEVIDSLNSENKVAKFEETISTYFKVRDCNETFQEIIDEVKKCISPDYDIL